MCELVMCGVGGRTLEEFKDNVSVEEFYTWLMYRRKIGGFSVVQKLEGGFATLASIHSGRPIKEFAPHLFPTEDEMIEAAPDLSLDNIGSVISINKNKELKAGEKFAKPKEKKTKMTKQGQFK